MRHFFTILLLIYGWVIGFSQTSESDTTIYKIVEIAPEFPGGEQALYKFLRDNINYPVMEQKHNIQGKVLIGFVVWRDGSIRNVEVLRGVSPGLDKEAVRIVSQMPKWKAGIQEGRAVACQYILPVIYHLR